MTTNGILPAQAIRALIEGKQVRLPEPPLGNQLQPASLDLRLGDCAWRVRASFLPGPNAAVADKIKDLSLHRIDLTESAVLETGCVYVAPLLESLALPSEISAAANPKSSTGRLDVFTRVIADGVSAFDQVPAGYNGPLYAEICPQTFPIIVRRGSRLSQIRFRQGAVADTDAALAELQQREQLVSSEQADIAQGKISILTPIGAALIGLSPEQSIAWMARDGREQRLTVLRVEPPTAAPAEFASELA